MIKKTKLDIGLLRHIRKTNNKLNYVELKPFLLYNFPEINQKKDRSDLKNFLKSIEKGGYIKIKSKKKIPLFKKKNDRIIEKKDFSIIAKLTAKGVKYLHENDKNEIEILLKVVSIYFVIITIFVSIKS